MSQEHPPKNTRPQADPLQTRINVQWGVSVDRAFAVALLMNMIPEYDNAELFFWDAAWNDEMGSLDVAIDLDVGGLGFKGVVDDEGRVHSTFDLILKTYGPQSANKQIMEALEPLARLLDNQQAYGSEGIRMIIEDLTEEEATFINDHSIIGLFRLMVGTFRERAKERGAERGWVDYQLILFARELLRQYVREAMAYVNAKALVASALKKGKIQIREESKVALCFDPIAHVQLVLFREYGIRVVVMVEGDDNILVRRKDSEQMRMDHPLIREVIERAGEKFGKNGWFVHPSGFFLAWQTRKGEQRGRGTNVDPWDMADAVEQAILAEDARVAQSK